MIDLQQRAMTGTTLTLNDTTTNPDQEKAFDIVEQLLSKDLDYTIEDEVEEGPGKDEQELEEDLNGLEPVSLELEEMSAMHEDLTQLQGSPELEAASILYRYSTAESEERGYALEVIRQCILEQRAPIEQKLQAAAVPLIVREHNYTDRVAAVQMVLTLIQGEAAKKYLAEKWQQLPSRDHRLSPLRENHHGHAFVTHLSSIYELACLDVLSPEIRDEMYSILRTTVPRFGDIGIPRLSS